MTDVCLSHLQKLVLRQAQPFNSFSITEALSSCFTLPAELFRLFAAGGAFHQPYLEPSSAGWWAESYKPAEVPSSSLKGQDYVHSWRPPEANYIVPGDTVQLSPVFVRQCDCFQKARDSSLEWFQMVPGSRWKSSESSMDKLFYSSWCFAPALPIQRCEYPHLCPFLSPSIYSPVSLVS